MVHTFGVSKYLQVYCISLVAHAVITCRGKKNYLAITNTILMHAHVSVGHFMMLVDYFFLIYLTHYNQSSDSIPSTIIRHPYMDRKFCKTK